MNRFFYEQNPTHENQTMVMPAGWMKTDCMKQSRDTETSRWLGSRTHQSLLDIL